MKKKILFAVLLCVLVVASVAIFVFVKNDSGKSAVNSEKTSSESDETSASAENTSSDNEENSVISENSSSEIEETSVVYDESSSAELITDPEKIKSLIDKCIEENGYKLGVRVGIDNSKNWILDEPEHEIVIVGLSVDYNRRSEIENWDEYLGEISDKVLECISDNNIDENYVFVYLYE
ncbi:hypothetical protein [Ruminococcus albus]|uniref:Uncharacterized protein n=1 Tax=Ruminococcus albus TaxID=1264 RepID=A0A1I1JHD8_RUMAL|nr:hypothetical protein [Ruminococcus albus]SFC46038.1 hypothetical protein SAMN02910406_01749 [Ruminococcus albus]